MTGCRRSRCPAARGSHGRGRGRRRPVAGGTCPPRASPARSRWWVPRRRRGRATARWPRSLPLVPTSGSSLASRPRLLVDAITAPIPDLRGAGYSAVSNASPGDGSSAAHPEPQAARTASRSTSRWVAAPASATALGVPASGSRARTACSMCSRARSIERSTPLGRAHEPAGGVEVAAVDRAAEQRAEVAAELLEGVDHREVVDALDEVVAGRLAELLVGGDDVEHVVDDLERHAVAPAELGELLDAVAGQVADDPADPAGGGEQRRRLALDRRRGTTPRCGRRRRRGAARAPRPRTAGRWWRPAGRPPRCRAPAAISDALARRKSPARIALRLPQRALTLSTPRRVSASSMTSSWHSEPTWTSSTATPPRITSSVTAASMAAASGARAAAEATANRGRARFPPAVMRWPPIWAISSSSAATAAIRASSTRAGSPAMPGRRRSGLSDTAPHARSGSPTHRKPSIRAHLRAPNAPMTPPAV